jgi:hypothetical protein
MAEQDDGAGSRQDPRIRNGALLLSALVLSPDSALERYRDQRAGDRQLDVEQLRRARDVLDAVAFAIAGAEPARWTHVEQAWTALRGDARRLPKLPPADASAARHAPGAEAPAQVSAGPAVDETAPVDISKVVPAERILPYRAAAEPSPLVRAAPSPPPAPRSRPSTPGSDVDQTMAMAPLGEAPAALPFAEPQRVGTPSLTVEQYASLRAELAARSAPHAELLARYDLADEEALRAVERHWEQRLRDAPAVRARFDQLLTHYRQWLAERRR